MIHPRERRSQSLRRRRASLLQLERLEARQLLTTADNLFTVTSAADTLDFDPATTPVADIPLTGTLRDALTWANVHPNDSPSIPDIINFSLQNPDPNNPDLQPTQQVITILTPLPALTDPVSIDGYTEWGSSTNHTLAGIDEQETDVAVLNVRIDGSDAQPDPSNPSAPMNGLTVDAPNCTIDGLSITGFQNGAGIELDPGPTNDTGAVGDSVWGNFLGVATFDTHSFNYVISGQNPLANGVGMMISSSNNRIGATLPPGRDVIQGNNGPGIELSGAAGNGNEIESDFLLDNNGDGVLITTSHNFIGEPIGLGPDGGGDVISGNVGDGVHILGAAAEGNVVVNSEIGTNIGLAGLVTPIRGMNPRPNTQDGILIEDSPGNTIGGTVTNARNVLAANGYDGLSIQNNLTTGATANQVLGNYVGFNLRGNIIADLPNRDGINISSSGNTIGGAVGSARNIIIENARNGITISGTMLDTADVPIPDQTPNLNARPTGNVILGNFIGTQGGGDRFGNTLDGIFLYDATDNTIGGTASGAGNTISANNDGVVIANAASGNVLQGNLIGTTSDGLNVLGNSLDGVLVEDSPGATIGGTASGAGNVLSGNKYGVRLLGGTTSDSLIEGNLIGTDLKGANAVRNAIDGVLIDQGASSNTVGGTAAGAGNTIAYNVADGVAVLADPDPSSGLVSVLNTISANSVFTNNLLGIDLGGDGVTPNHLGGGDTGPNDLQNYPVLTAVAPEGVGTNVQGTFNSASNVTFTLQFFASAVAAPLLNAEGQTVPDGQGNPLLVSQGATYLGQSTVTTDAKGNATFSVDLGVNVPSGQFVTATATSTAPGGGPGDTSEFSNALASVPVAVQFGAAAYNANEGDGSATITITRSGGSGGKVLVSYATSDGSAVSGTDYTPVAATLTFNPGETTKSFTVPILDAQRVGASETVDLSLSSPTGGATLGPQSSAVLTINDNEPETFQFGAPTYDVDADAGSVAVTVTRNTGNGSATVNLGVGGTAQAGTDYTALASDLLTFNPGQTTQTITIPVLDSHRIEPNPTLDLTLSNPSAGTIGAPSAAVVTIHETDQPGALQFGAPTFFAYEGGGAAAVSVTRTGGDDGTVTVQVALGGGTAQAGVDYNPPASTTLTFNPGVTTATLLIPVLGSHASTGNQTLNLSLVNPAGGATLGATASAILTIVENGTAGPAPSNDHVAPTVQGVNVLTNGHGVTGVVLTFSKPLNPTSAQNLGNYGYFFLLAGPDNAFGTSDDGSIPIASASYNAATLSVTLTPQIPLPLNMLAQLNIDRQVNLAQGFGLTDLAGNVLDGGGEYSTMFALGARLRYFDASGNNVTLQLTGGLMTLFLAPNGNAQDLRLLGTIPGRSTLTGSVKGRKSRTGPRTPLPLIEGTRGVRIRLKTPPFLIGARA